MQQWQNVIINIFILTQKVYSGEVACKVSKRCIEWLGGVGFTRDFIAEKFYRDCIIGVSFDNFLIIFLSKFMKEHQI
jgi:short/branched chain acyl-CoA dehydrogenase